MNIEILFKLLFQNSPLIGTFIIIGGLVKIFTYYKLFGISIFSFIEIKEVVTLFISNLLGYFIIVIFISLCIVFMDSFENNWIFALPIGFSFLTFIYLLFRKHVYFYEFIILNIIFWSIFLVVRYTLNQLHFQVIELEDGVIEGTVKYYFLALILISLICFSIFNAMNEYFKVARMKFYSKTVVKIEGYKFEPSINRYYIGNTEKYIFIHNQANNTTEVIPISKLENITFEK